ncbi:TPA: hypothetical protein PDO75_001778 [Staphylococcus aureus]|nr:hypothetical protein [Staphylococcus aureus]
MKKLLGLVLASTLILGACGSNDGDKKEESKKTETKKENKDKKKETKDKAEVKKENVNQNDNNNQVNNENNTNVNNHQQTNNALKQNQTQNNPASNKNNNAPVKDEFSSDTSYSAYQEAKRATEENKRQNGGHTAGIGGSWAVQDGQDYNSWKKAQNDFDNFKRQNSEVIQQ